MLPAPAPISMTVMAPASFFVIVSRIGNSCWSHFLFLKKLSVLFL